MATKSSASVSTPFSIDPLKDSLRPIGEVIQARLGKRISPGTLWRWRRMGVNGVRLQCLRLGGSWLTSDAAFGEFLRAQTANALASCAGQSADAPSNQAPSKARRLQAANHQ
jgi:hypothetical protein